MDQVEGLEAASVATRTAVVAFTNAYLRFSNDITFQQVLSPLGSALESLSSLLGMLCLINESNRLHMLSDLLNFPLVTLDGSVHSLVESIRMDMNTLGKRLNEVTLTKEGFSQDEVKDAVNILKRYISIFKLVTDADTLESISRTELTLLRLAEEIIEIRSKLSEIENLSCISSRKESVWKSLDPISLAEFDAHDSPPGCLIGTREAVLHDILNWARNGDVNKPLLWLHGVAGCGKTAVAKTVCERLAHRNHLGASFFATSQDTRRMEPLAVIRTIAYQLTHLDVTLLKLVHAAIFRQPDIMCRPMVEQVAKLIAEPLSAVQDLQLRESIVIVIDGFDGFIEIDGVKGGALLQLLHACAVKCSVKILISSRPGSVLQQHFQHLSHKSLCLHQVAESSVADDIRLFYKHQLACINISDYNVDELIRNTGGLFLYASTVVKYIKAIRFNPAERLGHVLDSKVSQVHSDYTFRHLDELYRQVLAAAVTDGSGQVNTELRDRARRLIGSLVCAQDPLSITALSRLLGFSVSQVVNDSTHLASVLAMPNDLSTGVLQIFHPSFTEYICDGSRCTDPNIIVLPPVHHTYFALACLRTMNQELKGDICDINYPFLPHEQVPDLAARLRTRVPAHLHYACAWWPNHVVLSEEIDDAVIQELNAFCHNRILNWIEVLGLTGRFPLAMSGLQRVQDWLEPRRHQYQKMGTVLDILQDAYQVCVRFWTPISFNALHVYHTAMVFMPDCCLYKAMSKEQDPVPRLAFQRSEDWGDPKAIDFVNSIAFSPNGTHMVTGSDNCLASVWDADGNLVAELNGHSHRVVSVAFSTNGKFVATGSLDCTVRVWSTSLFQSVHSPFVHLSPVTDLHFMSNDSCVVAASGRDILVWDISTGCLLATKAHVFRSKICNSIQNLDTCLLPSDSDMEQARRRLYIEQHLHSPRALTYALDDASDSGYGGSVLSCGNRTLDEVPSSREIETIGDDSSAVPHTIASTLQIWDDGSWQWDSTGWLYFTPARTDTPFRLCWVPPERRWTEDKTSRISTYRPGEVTIDVCMRRRAGGELVEEEVSTIIDFSPIASLVGKACQKFQCNGSYE